MITAENLASAISTAKPLFDPLQDLYEGLPETQCTCDEPGVCCMFLPEMTMLEALQWIERMQAMSEADLTSTLRRFVAFYLLGKPLGDLQSQFEEAYHPDFSFLLTSLAFGMRKELLLKFAVIKEIVQEKTDTRLQQELEKVSPTLLRFR